MKEPLPMPILSDTMAIGRILRWHKQAGDSVKANEVVAEVETDKAIMDVEATRAGFLAGPLAPTDTDIAVRTPIAFISDTRDEAVDEVPIAAAPQQEAPQSKARPTSEMPAEISRTGSKKVDVSGPKPERAAAPPAPHTGGRYSPYARALAADLGLNLEQVPAGVDGTVRSIEVVAAALGPLPADLTAGPPYAICPQPLMREAVARNMTAAWRTPVFHMQARLTLGPLRQLHEATGYAFTVLLARACARAIADHPLFNATYTRSGLAQRDRVDIGIALDLGESLIAPVLRDVGGRPLPALTTDWQRLEAQAKRHRLSLSEYTGATFYLSNLGSSRVVEGFDAILPLGATAILAAAAPATDERALFNLTCDHRVVFGADAARWFASFELHLSQPESWAQDAIGDVPAPPQTTSSAPHE